MCEKAPEDSPTPDRKVLKKFGLFGYEIGGWGSVLAFILAVAGLSLQTWGYLIGPDARVLPMKGVEFTCSDQDGHKCEPSANLIVVANRFTVANYGTEGYDTSIDVGSMEIAFRTDEGKVLRKITLNAQYFTKRTQIEITQEPVSKIYLKAGTGLDFEIAYYPRITVSKDGTTNRDNFLKFSKFKEMLVNGIEGTQIRSITVDLHPSATGRNRFVMKQSCEIIVDDRMRESALDLEVGTFPRDCFKEL